MQLLIGESLDDTLPVNIDFLRLLWETLLLRRRLLRLELKFSLFIGVVSAQDAPLSGVSSLRSV
jgi:hypothetical protein